MWVFSLCSYPYHGDNGDFGVLSLLRGIDPIIRRFLLDRLPSLCTVSCGLIPSCKDPYNNDCLVHSPRHIGLIPLCRDLIIKIVWFFHYTVKVNPIMHEPSQWRLLDPFTTIWSYYYRMGTLMMKIGLFTASREVDPIMRELL